MEPDIAAGYNDWACWRGALRPARHSVKEIEVDLPLRIVSGASEPRLLVIAGVHGDEYEPMVAVRRLWREFSERPIRGQVTLIPVVNRPAFLRGQRTAEDGLDLARTMPGRADGSVTEQIAAALASLIRQADFLIDLHTGGRQFRILPLSGYMLHPDQAVLERQREMARAFNLPIVWGTSPELEGRTLSVARDAHVPAIYVEAGGGGEFDPHAARLCIEGCLNVAGRLGIIEREAPGSAIQHVVEDDRAGSGHLQVQHPAPASGFFEPHVRLGDRVAQGQSLGRVVNAFGEHLGEVAAGESGIVLFQRAVPNVSAGESVGGVLPVAGSGG
jgi:predicted deacylase